MPGNGRGGAPLYCQESSPLESTPRFGGASAAGQADTQPGIDGGCVQASCTLGRGECTAALSCHVPVAHRVGTEVPEDGHEDGHEERERQLFDALVDLVTGRCSPEAEPWCI